MNNNPLPSPVVMDPAKIKHAAVVGAQRGAAQVILSNEEVNLQRIQLMGGKVEGLLCLFPQEPFARAGFKVAEPLAYRLETKEGHCALIFERPAKDELVEDDAKPKSDRDGLLVEGDDA
jgi:hypothetical protein